MLFCLCLKAFHWKVLAGNRHFSLLLQWKCPSWQNTVRQTVILPEEGGPAMGFFQWSVTRGAEITALMVKCLHLPWHSWSRLKCALILLWDQEVFSLSSVFFSVPCSNQKDRQEIHPMAYDREKDKHGAEGGTFLEKNCRLVGINWAWFCYSSWVQQCKLQAYNF